MGRARVPARNEDENMDVATFIVYTGRGRPPARGAAIRTLDGRAAVVTGYFATGRGTGVIAYTADGFTRLTACAVAPDEVGALPRRDPGEEVVRVLRSHKRRWVRQPELKAAFKLAADLLEDMIIGGC